MLNLQGVGLFMSKLHTTGIDVGIDILVIEKVFTYVFSILIAAGPEILKQRARILEGIEPSPRRTMQTIRTEPIRQEKMRPPQAEEEARAIINRQRKMSEKDMRVE